MHCLGVILEAMYVAQVHEFASHTATNHTRCEVYNISTFKPGCYVRCVHPENEEGIQGSTY